MNVFRSGRFTTVNQWRSLVDLVLFRSYAELLAERERTYLGFVWWIIAPAAFLGAFVLVFGGIFSNTSREFVAYLLVGLAWWQWFTSCLTHGASAVLENLGVIRQVRIPPSVFPIVAVLTDTYKFLFVLALLLIILWAAGFGPHASWLAVPILLVINLLAIFAITTLVAALVPLVPDTRFVVDNLLHVLMFLSGVFYYREQLPASKQWLLDFNPCYQMISTWRRVLIDGVWPEPGAFLAAFAIGILLIWLSAGVVSRFSDRYAKTPQ